MGYFVNITDSCVSIPKDRFSEACKHLADSGFLDGGRYHGVDGGNKWYAWVDMPELRVRVEQGDLPGVFDSFDFVCYYDEKGDICELSYDQKCGDEVLLLDTLAPFFADGNFIDWKGEDGDIWRYEFRGGKMNQMVAEIVWRHTMHRNENTSEGNDQSRTEH